MQGNDENETNSSRSKDEENGDDNDWCAVCHDGGDTLYCCDRCPKVYHMYCFIPTLTEEPPDDWVYLNSYVKLVLNVKMFIYFFVYSLIKKKNKLLCNVHNEITQPFLNLEGAL